MTKQFNSYVIINVIQFHFLSGKIGLGEHLRKVTTIMNIFEAREKETWHRKKEQIIVALLSISGSKEDHTKIHIITVAAVVHSPV